VSKAKPPPRTGSPVFLCEIVAVFGRPSGDVISGHFVPTLTVVGKPFNPRARLPAFSQNGR